MKQLKLSLLWTLLLAVISLPATGQTLRSDDALNQLAGFGGAIVAGDGDVIIGSAGATIKPGQVMIFRSTADGWTEASSISASDGVADNRFGRAMAMHGSTLLVGATVQDQNKGAAYIFNKNADGEWTETTKLVPASIVEGDNFGRVASLTDEFAFISSIGKNEARGAVYAFHNSGDAMWKEMSGLAPDSLESGDYFGFAVSGSGNRVLVGSPALQRQEESGAAYIFKYDEASGTWMQEAMLENADLDPRSGFGASVLLTENYALIGAPGADQGTGAVYIYAFDSEAGSWDQENKLVAFDSPRRGQFGASLARNGSAVWIGAPFSNGFTGSVYVYDFDGEADAWSGGTKLWAKESSRGSGFAGSFAIDGDVAVIGAERADNGLGNATIFEKSANGEWMETATLITEEAGMEAVLGAKVDCEEGSASLFGCEKVDLMSFMPISAVGGGRGVRLNDVWGWTDPETGVEYTLLGRVDGASFVDISDPYNPKYIGDLPLTEGAQSSTWRDIKVYKDHAFIVADGAGDHGMQIFDLRQLRDVNDADMPVTFEATAHYDKIASAHNIVINEDTGYAYSVGSSSGGETCGGGLHMINIQDPLQPTFAGCFADPATGRASTGYTHDAQCVTYNGPDSDYQGREICFNANETALSIGDVTDKENTVAISRASYPNVAYSHQGWLTDDHKYFYMNDELDEMSGNVSKTRTLIWDVQDLDDPQLLKEFLLETESSDHNLYIKGNLMYQSNYNAGLRILDITDIENPVEVGHFDTNPFGDNGPGFDGSWSNYPYFKSGVIAVSSIGQGLFLVKTSNIDI